MTTAEIIDVTPDEYHALPGLSSSIAKVLNAQSPLHAQTIAGKKPTPVMDFGTVAHRLVLGKGKAFAVLDFDDWKTKAARESRDEARAAGLVPIKTADFERAQKVADAATAQLKARGIVLDGDSEVAVRWYEPSPSGPVLCRAMFDHVWIAKGKILDLKITGDASPSFTERNAENLGYAIQASAYTRAMTALRPDLGGRVRFAFAFAEDDAPYALNLCAPDGPFAEIGERRWLRAVNTWGRCQETGIWPGYGDSLNTISPPPWALSREGYEA